MTSGKLRNLRSRTAAQVGVAVGAAVTAAAVLAACGGSSTAASAAAAATPSTTASLSRNAVYLDCLRQHGADIPTAFPSRGGFTARPTGPRPSAGFGGPGGGFFGQGQNPQMQAAMRACVSVRPTGGFGGRGATQAAAFRNCMTQQSVTIPTTRPTAFPTAPPTDRAARYLNGLNPSDPKVAAALRVCSPLLPSPGARASGTRSG